METEITGRSTGVTTTELFHPSGASIKTSWPKNPETGGDGLFFTPLDILVSSLGAMEATAMTYYAKKNGIDLTSLEFKIKREMTSPPSPRRVAKIEIHFQLAGNFSDDDLHKLITVAKSSSVDETLIRTSELVHSFTRI